MSNYKRNIAKRTQEEEATAYAFQEFIDTFQNVTPVKGKAFIKSAVYHPGNASECNMTRKRFYQPQPLLLKTNEMQTKKALECARLVKTDGRFEKGNKNAANKPKSNLEMLKEELRLRHLDRDWRKKQCYDHLDTTTNLFLTNLSVQLNEQALMQIFGVYGPLASVKIMWPRQDERVRNNNVGFVAFMSRRDSERAYTALQHRDDMKVTWGKPIEIPMHPIYIPPELVKMMLPPPYSGLPFNAQPLKKRNARVPVANGEEMTEILKNSLVKVTIPLDKIQLMVIHRVIEFVIREGPIFEAFIMNKEMNNAAYKFLFDNKSAAHIYYRWKLYSLMHGESYANWRTQPFRMFRNGSIWVPPTLPDYTHGMELIPPSSSSSSSTLSNTLSDHQQLRFIQMLQQLRLKRKSIADALAFCMQHVHAAKQIVQYIAESFENVGTLMHKKIARLYLLSDILHNTKMPLFKSYLDLFHTKLLRIFEHLDSAYKCNNMEQEFRLRVLKVLRAWETWNIYPNDFLEKLEVFFLDDENDTTPLDGEQLITRSLNYNQPTLLKDVIVHKEKEENKENKENKEENKENFSNFFVQSKWETIEPDELEAQAMSTQQLYSIERERTKDERRKRCERELGLDYARLRKIELRVCKYQDALESGERRWRKKVYRTIEQQVNAYRRRCIERTRRHLRRIMASRPKMSSDSFSSDDGSSNSSSSNKHRRRRKKRRKM